MLFRSYWRVEKIYYIMLGIVCMSGLALWGSVYYGGDILLHLWLGAKQVTPFNESVLIIGAFYAITRSLGMPLSILIIANNRQKNYSIGPIFEALAAGCSILIAMQGFGIKWIFMGLGVGAIGSILTTLGIAYRNPCGIGFKSTNSILACSATLTPLLMLPFSQTYLINL